MAHFISYLMYNFTLTFFLVGLLVSAISILTHRQGISRQLVVESLISWFVFHNRRKRSL